MAAPTDLEIARLERVESNRDITPEQLVKMLLAHIQSGEIKPMRILVIFEEDREDGCIELNSYRANLNLYEHMALCEMEKLRTRDRWVK